LNEVAGSPKTPLENSQVVLKRRRTMREHPIVVTELDARKLRRLLGGHGEGSLRDEEHLRKLKSELERALVVDAAEVPTDVITMYTRVLVLDLGSGQRNEYVLVVPGDSDVSARRISVLAPLGTALLGYREGDEVEWEMPGGLRRLRIERAVQPASSERAGTGMAQAAMPALAMGLH
jgi:regulator of nucleoside diphosphate kinase